MGEPFKLQAGNLLIANLIKKCLDHSVICTPWCWADFDLGMLEALEKPKNTRHNIGQSWVDGEANLAGAFLVSFVTGARVHTNSILLMRVSKVFKVSLQMDI
mmetsp:Transcript_146754/g.468835  ORF Transcript_146754/g.468835 Transcript_146754/m.468835 type:complete len:102 (+) Transcript_146754:62-367(+)